MTRILIVDDHAPLRRAVREILTDGLPEAVVDEVADAESALRRLADDRWDLVLLDLALGDRRGLETLRQLKHLRPDLQVLVMSMHPEAQYAAAARAAGAAGYLMKGVGPGAIVDAARSALGRHPPG